MAKKKPAPAPKKKAPPKKRSATPRAAKKPAAKKPAPKQPAALTADAIRIVVRETIAELGLAPVPRRGANGVDDSRPAQLPTALLVGARGLPGLGARAFPPPPPLAPPIAPEGRLGLELGVAVAAGRTLFPGAPGLDKVVCLLKCQYPGGSWSGSGVMLDSRTVLTVAHNIYNKFDNATARKITQVTIFPAAFTDAALPPAAADASLCHVPPQWEAFVADDEYQNDHRDRSPFDYGIIHFPTDPGWGDFPCIGWNVVDEVNFPSSWFEKTPVHLFGYPLNNPGQAFPSLPGKATPQSGAYLKYNMIAVKGQSGGPVYFYYPTQDGGVWAFLLGVQSMTFDDPYSLGVRMTASVVADIDRWTNR